MAALTRTTVNLTPKAAEARDAAAKRDRLSPTDIINRALIAYDSISEELARGNKVLIEQPDGTVIRWFLL